MNISELRCRNFRNLEDITLRPCEGVNVVFGENAQGKTNVMEAIWLFSGMKSFRGAKDAELISHGKEFAKLSLKFSDSVRENTAVITGYWVVHYFFIKSLAPNEKSVRVIERNSSSVI